MRLVIQGLIPHVSSTSPNEPMRPLPDVSGRADASSEVRCPLCHKLHAQRAKTLLIIVLVVERGTPPDRGLTIKCRCGAFLELVPERVAA